MREALTAELRAVGDHDHLGGRSHHRPLRLDQQQVVVEEALLANARHAEDRLPHPNHRQHSIGVGAAGDARSRADIAADQHQIAVAVGSEQVGHRQRRRNNVQRPPDQQPRKLVGGAAAVQEDCVAVVDQPGRSRRDHVFLFPIGGLLGVKMGQLGRNAGVKHAAVKTPGHALLLQLIQIAPDRRFRHRKLLGQFRQRGKPPNSDQFQQSAPTLFSQHGNQPGQ